MPEFDRSAIAERWRRRLHTNPCAEVETDLRACIDELDRLRKECDSQISHSAFKVAEQRGYRQGLEAAAKRLEQLFDSKEAAPFEAWTALVNVHGTIRALMDAPQETGKEKDDV